jgi:hypothetical protein
VEITIEVLRVQGHNQTHLFKIRLAGRFSTLLLHTLERRHQDGHQHGDNRNDHKQLYQRKSFCFGHHILLDLIAG